MRETKTYRKTATIEAEQFDGSPEMINRYQIGIPRSGYIGNKPSYILYTLEGAMNLEVGDWIATGVKGEQWAIADDVFKQTYEEVESIEIK